MSWTQSQGQGFSMCFTPHPLRLTDHRAICTSGPLLTASPFLTLYPVCQLCSAPSQRTATPTIWLCGPKVLRSPAIFFFVSMCRPKISVEWCSVTSVVSDSLQLQDCSLPDISVHGILQARILGWVAIFFSRVDISFKTDDALNSFKLDVSLIHHHICSSSWSISTIRCRHPPPLPSHLPFLTPF